MKYEKCRKLLYERQTNLKCREVLKVLADLGFRVKSGRAGHKMFRHPEIPSFHGSNFNCGHSAGYEIKPIYIRSILRVIDEYESELKEILGE